MTASAPRAIALETSPPVRMPPSAMTLQYCARLEQVLDAGRGGVGDGRRLGHADAQHAARGAGVARADADQHADRRRCA